MHTVKYTKNVISKITHEVDFTLESNTTFMQETASEDRMIKCFNYLDNK